MGGSCACHFNGSYPQEYGGSLLSNAAGGFKKGGERGFSLDFTGRLSIKGYRGRISMLCEYSRLAHLPLPAQGNQPGKQHPSNFERMHSGMEAPAPTRSRDARRSSPCRNRNQGGHGCDGHYGGRYTWEHGMRLRRRTAGKNKKRPEFAPSPYFLDLDFFGTQQLTF